jgi:hypothetical protein
VPPTAHPIDSGSEASASAQSPGVPNPLAQELRQRLLQYGATNDPALADPISALYARAITELSEATRMEMVLVVSDLAEQQKVSANPLFPFMFRDPSPAIVSTAALNLATLWAREGENPLKGVDFVAQQAHHCADRGDEERSAAILGGLLLLGDRRVTEYLKGCWRWLPSLDGRTALLSSLNSEFVHAPVVDWLIDWLDDCEGSEFGRVAGTISWLSRVAWAGGVFEVQRSLPFWSAVDGQPLHEVARWSFAEFGERIQPRLELIAATESEPRVMHRVLERWGLTLYGPPPTRSGVPGRRQAAGRRRSLLSRLPKGAVHATTPVNAILLSEEDFADYGGDLLLCWGIFNRSGPTWSCLGRLRTENPDVDLLFYRMLHPFSQDSVAISSLVGPDRTDGRFLSRTLRELFVRNTAGSVDEEALYLLREGSAPTFVLMPWENAEFRRAVPDFFKQSPAVLGTDLAENIESMKRYWGRPWDREAAERDDALASHLASGEFDDLLDKYPGLRSLAAASPSRDPELRSSREGPADATLVEQWYHLISDPEHLRVEVGELAKAWWGAIDADGDSTLVQNPYPFELLDAFLTKFGFPALRQNGCRSASAALGTGEL